MSPLVLRTRFRKNRALALFAAVAAFAFTRLAGLAAPVPVIAVGTSGNQLTSLDIIRKTYTIYTVMLREC